MKQYTPTFNEFVNENKELNEKKYPYVINDDDQDDDASYHGVSIYTTADLLNKVLFKVKPKFDGKTTYRWNCSTDAERNILFTIYDFRERDDYNKIGKNERTSFHIGASSKEWSEIAKDIVTSLIDEYYSPIDKKSIKKAKSIFNETQKDRRKELLTIWNKFKKNVLNNDWSEIDFAYPRVEWVSCKTDSQRYELIHNMLLFEDEIETDIFENFNDLVYSIIHFMDLHFSVDYN